MVFGKSIAKIKYYIDNHKCPVCLKKANIYEVTGDGYYIECSTCTPFHFPKNFLIGFLTNGLDDHHKYKITKLIKNHSQFINIGRIKKATAPASRTKATLYAKLHYPIYKDFHDKDADKYFTAWRKLI